MLNFSSNSSNSCKIPRNFFDDILLFSFDLIFAKAFDFFSTIFICLSNAGLFGLATKPFRFHLPSSYLVILNQIHCPIKYQ